MKKWMYGTERSSVDALVRAVCVLQSTKHQACDCLCCLLQIATVIAVNAIHSDWFYYCVVERHSWRACKDGKHFSLCINTHHLFHLVSSQWSPLNEINYRVNWQNNMQNVHRWTYIALCRLHFSRIQSTLLLICILHAHACKHVTQKITATTI